MTDNTLVTRDHLTLMSLKVMSNFFEIFNIMICAVMITGFYFSTSPNNFTAPIDIDSHYDARKVYKE